MDDISLPATLTYGPTKPDRPPYASQAKPSTFAGRSSNIAELAVDKTIVSGESFAPPSNWQQPIRCTILVLKSSETFTMRKYRRDGDLLVFEELDGTKGAVDMHLVDWRKTTERNRIISAD